MISVAENLIVNESNQQTTAEIFDPAFGIRISNPKVTLDTLNTFCSGMRKMRLGHLNSARLQSQQKNGGEEWVTMGVVVEKSECKKSASGNEYLIWRISDLTELNAVTVKVLLFGDCVREYWKLQSGNTILLNNPQCAEQQANDTGNRNEVTLKLSKVGQVIEIGFCPDLGRCQGRKASDGDQCSHFVNISHSLYCPFHLQQRARQVSANRGTLNRSANLPPKNWEKFKEPNGGKGRGKGGWDDGEAQPPGLTTLSRRHSADQGKIYTKPVSMVHRGLRIAKPAMDRVELDKRSQEIEKLIAENPDNFGSKNLRIMRRQKENQDPREKAEKLTQSAANQHSVRSMREFIQSQTIKASPSTRSADVDSSCSSAKRMSNAEMKEQMKIKRAAQILKNSGQQGNNQVKRQKLNQFEDEDKGDGGQKTSRGPLLGASFTPDQIRALLAKKSAHEEEAVEEELNRQNAYFDRRAVEEQIETNATTLMEIKGCKVVSCKQCDYTSAQQSAHCRMQGHDVKRHQADKRFFKCMDCQRRTISYERMPTKPCLSCKSSRFSRVAMRDERKVLLEEEKLKIKEEEGNFSTTVGKH